jgi:hypothetical protein
VRAAVGLTTAAARYQPGGPEQDTKRKQPDRSIRLSAFRAERGRACLGMILSENRCPPRIRSGAGFYGITPLALAPDRVAAPAVAGLHLAVAGGLRGGLIGPGDEHRRHGRDRRGKQYCCDYWSNHRFPEIFSRREKNRFDSSCQQVARFRRRFGVKRSNSHDEIYPV